MAPRLVRPADYADPESPWRNFLIKAGAVLTTIGVIVVLAGAVFLGLKAVSSQDSDGADSQNVVVDESLEQDTTLFVVTHPATGEALNIVLFGYTPEGDERFTKAMFIPVSLMSLIPGIGMDQLSKASRYENVDLTVATVENLLGISVDSVVSGNSEQVGSWLQEIGGLDVTVPEKTTGTSLLSGEQVSFDKGKQFLTGPESLNFAFLQKDGEKELDTLFRQELVLDSLFEVLEDDEVLDDAFGVKANRIDIKGDRQLVVDLFSNLSEDIPDFGVLPVKPVGNRTETSLRYSPSWDEMRSMVNNQWSGSFPDDSRRAPLPIQILNGVGEPGIGQEIDRRLSSMNLRIIISENADNFSYPNTQIVVYSDDREIIRTAEEIVEQLGVGTLLRSTQPQSVVDISIIIGADYLATRDDSPVGVPNGGADPVINIDGSVNMPSSTPPVPSN